MNTLYWHDYETFGVDPRYDRPAQFAGIRTDENLNIISDPLTIYCQQANDSLPHPRACLITKLTPQKVNQEGLIEAEFIKRIHTELSQANTCSIGYNNINFDDEFTRFTLYRNFYDAYAREWQHGNSRWDIINMARLTRALRPDGINWPNKEDGTPSFKLEDLSKANDIEHQSAHDALSDVYATIALAKLIKTAQPKLYEFVYQHRHKNKIKHLLDAAGDKQQPVIHVSRMYPGQYCGLALVMPVALHPSNKNGVIVYDLRHDPRILINETVDTLRQWLFTPVDNLPENAVRPALKTLHINKCPVVAPAKILDDEIATRLAIDKVQHHKHLHALQNTSGLTQKIMAIYDQSDFIDIDDMDGALYSGDFFKDSDKRLMADVRNQSPHEMNALPAFNDQRLPDMLFRYRARNWPNTLSSQEQTRWQKYRQKRLHDKNSPALTFDQFYQEIADCKNEELTQDQHTLLADLVAYADTLKNS